VFEWGAWCICFLLKCPFSGLLDAKKNFHTSVLQIYSYLSGRSHINLLKNVWRNLKKRAHTSSKLTMYTLVTFLFRKYLLRVAGLCTLVTFLFRKYLLRVAGLCTLVTFLFRKLPTHRPWIYINFVLLIYLFEKKYPE
jgi:hypothetical protein